jgi:hypothetical protein
MQIKLLTDECGKLIPHPSGNSMPQPTHSRTQVTCG